MATGIYTRTEKHIDICRKAGLASPTKFKKGHKGFVNITSFKNIDNLVLMPRGYHTKLHHQITKNILERGD